MRCEFDCSSPSSSRFECGITKNQESKMHSSKQMKCEHDQCRRDNIARQRWLLLGKALLQAKNNHTIAPKAPEVSLRSFSNFGLLSSKRLSSEETESEDSVWFQYSSPSHSAFSVQVQYVKEQFSPQELMGFNNTGNVCIWPSEEALTYYCLQNIDMFRGKTVCELGGGMTCLAGLAVATCSDPAKVILTDGNELSCENVEVVVEKNRSQFPQVEIDVRKLRWNEASSFRDLGGCVDVILSADCLFFDQYRSDLVDAISTLLTSNGIALVFAPRRGHTLEKFILEAKQRFHLTLEENYDPTVWAALQNVRTKEMDVFDENIHYPLKITLRRKLPTEIRMNHCRTTNGINHSELP